MNASTLKKLIELADAHQEADEYLSGQYEWRGGAYAIGCTMRDAKKIGIIPENAKIGDHAALAAANGVPEMAWRLCDHIFEGLDEKNRRAWTPRFLRAIRPNADYTSLPARVMARCARKLAENAIDPKVRACCLVNAGLWERRGCGQEPKEEEWDAARQQAYAARRQAYAAWRQADAAWRQADAAWRQADAARRQAYAAWRQADAAWQQAYAAWQQAYAARQQADAAWQQADAAWRQADAARRQADAAWRQADAARQQADAARRQFWLWCADMLCEEMQR